jgi:hypothetical protein
MMTAKERQAYNKKWRESHKNYHKKWYKENKEQQTAYKKSYYKANTKASHKRTAAYIKRRRLKDINFRLRIALRSRICAAIHKHHKTGSAVRDLGCTIPEFKHYIEQKFTSGMSWDNYGKWHLDHIRPLVSFNLTDREQFLQACHYTNYQPLWAKDNLRKGAKC